MLRGGADDLFIGSPPLAFTFGLGGLLLFPLRVGARRRCCSRRRRRTCCSPRSPSSGATMLFTAPTAYRAMAAQAHGVRPVVAAQVRVGGRGAARGDAQAWQDATGIEIIDGIGATEMLHIFISHADGDARPGATGRRCRATRRASWTTTRQPLPAGTIGRLAVQGPTGCRYLDDPRQRDYVRDGWNFTGDAYLHGRRRLLLLPRAHRRHDHLVRATTSRARRWRARCWRIRRSPSAASSACPTRSAARS